MAKRNIDFDNPQFCMCANLRRATRAITRLYDVALAPAGLTATQFSLLATLNAAGAIRIGEFATFTGTDRTTLTRTLSRLEAEGLTETRDGEDARERVLAITSEGRKRLKLAMPRWRAAQRRITNATGDDVSRSIIANITAIEAACEGL